VAWTGTSRKRAGRHESKVLDTRIGVIVLYNSTLAIEGNRNDEVFESV
jgi:hypothetical protein